MNFHGHQGDVFFELVPQSRAEILRGKKYRIIPRDAQGCLILARGETSGHGHVIYEDADLVELEDGRRFLFSEKGIRLLPSKGGKSKPEIRVYKDHVGQEGVILAHVNTTSGTPTRDHAWIGLPTGSIEIIQQVEYTPKGLRPVSD